MINVQGSKWEPDARTEPAPRSEPEPRTEPDHRTEPAARTEPSARTEPLDNKIQTIKCPSCGYLLVFAKGTGKQSVSCSKCGNVFQVE